MKEIIILGVLIRNEVVDVVAFQQLLTTYGNVIRTRLGLHENHYEASQIKGLLLLELVGDMSEIVSFEEALSSIRGMEVQRMCFSI